MLNFDELGVAKTDPAIAADGEPRRFWLEVPADHADTGDNPPHPQVRSITFPGRRRRVPGGIGYGF